MSFYSEQQEAMIDSNTPGAQLHTLTNLAATPQANVIIVHGLAEYAALTPSPATWSSMTATSSVTTSSATARVGVSGAS